MMNPDQYKPLVSKLYVERRKRGPLSALELELWSVAEQAPYGGIVINREGLPYLLRVFLVPSIRSMVEMPSVYLHYFIRGDMDKHPHNHPYSHARSLILTGGYKEHSIPKWHREVDWDPEMLTKIYRHGQWNNGIDSDTFHKVELLNPDEGCWTLFCGGPRLQESDGTDWGFYDRENRKFIPWGNYVRMNQTTSLPLKGG